MMSGDASSAFVAVRPPGHHAGPSSASGFCFFNNVAVAACHAVTAHKAERMAIVDWDVHHGNGTQDGFSGELFGASTRAADVFFASSHQSPCYPGTGDSHLADTYALRTNGRILNVPLKPLTGSTEFRQAWRDSIIPRLRAFAPDIILVSAGFDAHTDDPLAELELTDADFGWVQTELCHVAAEVCGGRLVAVLEGGYNLDAIARSAERCVRAQCDASGYSGGFQPAYGACELASRTAQLSLSEGPTNDGDSDGGSSGAEGSAGLLAISAFRTQATLLGYGDAVDLWWRAVQAEREEMLDEAVALYRQAFRLWPALDSGPSAAHGIPTRALVVCEAVEGRSQEAEVEKLEKKEPEKDPEEGAPGSVHHFKSVAERTAHST